MLDDVSVGNELGVVSKLLLESRLGSTLFVLESHNDEVEHNAIGDCDFVSGHELSASICKLLFEVGEHGAPLLLTKFSIFLLLRSCRCHRETDICSRTDKLTPSVDDPVNFCCLSPVASIVVALLDANGAQDGAKLLHVFALVVNDWQLAHLASILGRLAPDPASHVDSLLFPLNLSMGQKAAKGLSPTMYIREILNAYLLRLIFL